MTKEYRNVQPKPFTRFGNRYEPTNTQGEFNADVIPGVSVRIFGVMTNSHKGPVHFDRTFNIGDEVEIDSYNLTYTGQITAIGPQSVTVCRGGRRSKRFNLYDFINRNYDLDLEKIAKENADTMAYI